MSTSTAAPPSGITSTTTSSSSTLVSQTTPGPAVSSSSTNTERASQPSSAPLARPTSRPSAVPTPTPTTCDAPLSSPTMVTDASDTAAAAQASFDAIAGQIKAASHDAADADAPAGAVAARLDAIEQAQERLAEELEVVRLQLARAHLNGKGREVVAEDEEGAGGPPAALQKTLEELAGKVDKLGDTVKMDQQRLYIRMQNATVNTKKGAIKAPPTVNGKPPPNFPATKGEFEHMTKERYEGIMKAYDMPLKGDTEVKREALRQFLGLGPMQ